MVGMNKYNLLASEEVRVQKTIINDRFGWEDLDGSFSVTTTANIYCPFHDNYNTPSARFYETDDTGKYVLWCFSERRFYTPYDYVNLIMVQSRRQYESVWDFLEQNLPEQELKEHIIIAQKYVAEEDEINVEEKRNYIRNLYNTYDDLSEFINRLYLEKE